IPYIRKVVNELDSSYYLANVEYFKQLSATEDSIKGSAELKKAILRRCIRLNPKVSYAYTKLAELSVNYYEKMANLDSAIKLLDKEAFAAKAQTLFNNNQYEDVVKFMNSVPRQVIDTNTFIKKAYSEFFTGLYDEAEATLAAYSSSG